MSYIEIRNKILIGVLILVAVMIMSNVIADDDAIISELFEIDDEFEMDDVDYTIKASKSSLKVFIESTYSNIILGEGKCSTVGYYTFCFDNFNWSDFWEYTTANISIYKLNCTYYLNESKEKVCKFHVGEECNESIQCMSSKCLHNVCTFTDPICGDGFCDDGENCDEDCFVELEINDTGINDSSINDTITNTADVINGTVNGTINVTDANNSGLNNSGLNGTNDSLINDTLLNGTSMNDTSENNTDSSGEAVNTTDDSGSRSIDPLGIFILFAGTVLILILAVLIYRRIKNPPHFREQDSDYDNY